MTLKVDYFLAADRDDFECLTVGESHSPRLVASLWQHRRLWCRADICHCQTRSWFHRERRHRCVPQAMGQRSLDRDSRHRAPWFVGGGTQSMEHGRATAQVWGWRVSLKSRPWLSTSRVSCSSWRLSIQREWRLVLGRRDVREWAPMAEESRDEVLAMAEDEERVEVVVVGGLDALWPHRCLWHPELMASKCLLAFSQHSPHWSAPRRSIERARRRYLER